MASNPVADHAQILRVIGQVLELVKAEAYDIVSHRDRFLVRCLTQQGKISRLASILRVWRNRNLPRISPGLRPSMNVELLYALRDIETLDENAKGRRRDQHGMPDPFSLSSTLRTTGDFLNHKGNCRLIFLSKHDHDVVVLFETFQGVRQLEEYQLSSFYDSWVQMYIRRKQKSPSGPKS